MRCSALLSIVFQIVFSILGSMVVFWFSRWREFRADAGGARLAGRQNMIDAFRALQRLHRSRIGAGRIASAPCFSSAKDFRAGGRVCAAFCVASALGGAHREAGTGNAG